MSVTQLKQELEAIQTTFEDFKAGCSKQFKKAYDLENEFMNAFEDLNLYVSSETTQLLNTLSKHTELVNTFKREYDTNKFEEGNFNRVSIIKKQDDTIKTLEIKVAELEMRLASAEKNQSRQAAPLVKEVEQPTVCTGIESSTQCNATGVSDIPIPTQSEQIQHQCYARVGKAKYNISKQASDFMTEFPEGSFITKTGCVVGLPCANTVAHTNVLFCPEHNTGKFEDIRTEPGTPQVSIIHAPEANMNVHVEPQQVEKKKPATRKKKEVTVPEPVVQTVPEPIEQTVTEELVEQPVPEPIEQTVTEEPVEQTVPEPVEQTVTEEPVEQTVTEEPVYQVSIPALNLTFEQEDMLDDQSPPMSPVVDISTINQTNQPDTLESVQDPCCTDLSHTPPHMVPHVVNIQNSVIEPPSFDDIEFYDDPATHKTYYLDSKTKRIFEIAPNDEIGVFVKQL
jgi:hypothetical protein